MIKSLYTTIFFILFILGCHSTTQKPVADETKQVKMFKMVEVPLSIADPMERGTYIAKHYWDNFDFSDTTYINIPDVTEQAFADYCNIMSQLPVDMASESIKNMLSKAITADSSMFGYMCELSEKYMYDPNSPMMNEELYIPVLEYIVSSNKVDSLLKIRPKHQLTMAMKNRRGDIAADFEFTTISGAPKKLGSVKSPYTLLFFYNLGCPNCKEVKEYIKNSDILDSPDLKIVAVYPDTDIEEWKKQGGDIPDTWINGSDVKRKLKDNELYDLKAIPTLYLLDSEKRVLLKDAKIEFIEDYFAGN